MFPRMCRKPPCRNMLVTSGISAGPNAGARMGQRRFRARGNQAELLHELITRARRQAELISEDGNVRQNQQDVDDGKACGAAFRCEEVSFRVHVLL